MSFKKMCIGIWINLCYLVVISYTTLMTRRIANIGELKYRLMREFKGNTKYIVVRCGDWYPIDNMISIGFKVMGGVNSFKEFDNYIKLKSCEEVAKNV